MMRELRSRKSIAGVFTVFLLLSFLGAVRGFVFCCGPGDHMHVETTFNGVNCGHFPRSPVRDDVSQYRTTDTRFPATPCFACTDIPLSSPHYLVHKKSFNGKTYAKKLSTAAADLAFPSHALTRLTPIACRPPAPAVNSHGAPRQILSSILRI